MKFAIAVECHPSFTKMAHVLIVEYKMIEEIINLSKQLKFSPSPDPKSLEKLGNEVKEFEEALNNNDLLGSALELADVVYYSVKLVYLKACELNEKFNKKITIKMALEICVAKYSLRARKGNPKDDKLERQSIKKFLGDKNEISTTR
jgi:phosphoribosyl-ATP pyrophosphohydrolase